MELKALLRDVELLKINADLSLDINGITENSKKIKEGFIFVAFKGSRFDGNAFIESALEMGAVCIVTEYEPKEEVPYILVKDVRSALSVMLSNFYHRPQESFKMSVGITGTNGKTSTSVMLKNIFESANMKVGLIGTVKYLIGDEEFNSACRQSYSAQGRGRIPP